jgi:hypothetical protein
MPGKRRVRDGWMGEGPLSSVDWAESRVIIDGKVYGEIQDELIIAAGSLCGYALWFFWFLFFPP